MVRFEQNNPQTESLYICRLHSIMVRFERQGGVLDMATINSLHSIMVRFEHNADNLIAGVLYVYIPLW